MTAILSCLTQTFMAFDMNGKKIIVFGGCSWEAFKYSLNASESLSIRQDGLSAALTEIHLALLTDV